MSGGGVLVDHPCPECGFDGPHPVLGTDCDWVLVECGSCVSEFSTPIPPASLPPGDAGVASAVAREQTNDEEN